LGHCRMEEPPPTPENKRYHDLDALRAFAMLLGIALHGFMSFIPLPFDVWPAQEIHQDDAYETALHAIHAFRLPLFFVLSGFFTAMLWRRRGLKDLAKHRAKRILWPLLTGTLLVWPLLILVVMFGAQKAGQSEQNTAPSRNLWEAAAAGNMEAMRKFINDGADVNANDPLFGTTPLTWAALLGKPKAVDLLLKEKAHPDRPNRDGGTPLHAAAFLGEQECVKLLIEAGANVNARNHNQETPMDVITVSWIVTKGIADFLQIPVDEKAVKKGRERSRELLQAKRAVYGKSMPKPEQDDKKKENLFSVLLGLLVAGAMVPVFHHLWFLYYLAWLVAGFVLVVWLAEKRGWNPLPGWVTDTPWCWIWLFIFTLVPQLMMGILSMLVGLPSFGPDTASGIVPWPPKLLYYAVFFAVGAAWHGTNTFEKHVGQHWWLCLALAVPAFQLGLGWYDDRNTAFEKAGDENWAEVARLHAIMSIATVAYTWLMIAGCIGLFRFICPGKNGKMRYLSDASYWLYLAHLPLIMAVQIWVSDWQQPGILKFLFICAFTTGVLLIVYEYAVRYTFIGTALNGRRTRVEAPPSSRA